MYTYKHNDSRVPIKVWAIEGTIEQGALQQIQNVATLPFVFHHVALMPDAHEGYGMPIGGVVALDGVVCPNMVGVDIGCGMLAVKTSLTEITKEQIKVLFGGSAENKGGIRSRIPVGFSHHSKKQPEILMPDIHEWINKNSPSHSIVEQEYNSALWQLGSLGGGNHFCEIQKGSDGHIWFMIHSGSRNIGYKIAEYYNKLAKELNARWHTGNPKHDLSFLPVDSSEGRMYIAEMKYAMDFALANRKKMASDISEEFASLFSDITFDESINISHNFASLENHFGKNVWVHRKGATLARQGTIGIIPGSMGTHSYIVEGLGNPDSFMSSSHGAGRVMSRSKAKEDLDLATEQAKMGDVVHGLRNASDLDEAPGSYKDIEEVMENQKDLVKILVELTPLGVIKG